MATKGLTEADIYGYLSMCSGKYGPQWTAIRKLVAEVRGLRQDLLATKPAGVIRNNDLDAVLVASTDLHRALTTLIPKLRPVPIDDHGATRQPVLTRANADNSESGPGSSEPQRVAATKMLLSVSEATASLGLGRTMVWDLVNKGKLKSLRIGRRRLIPRDALQAFLESERAT